MTINKSQKQTLEKIGILLRESVFTHGQLYVAAGRVRPFNGIEILDFRI
jgi:ATP-dependent exoDNAse (exonuclease V) alpha subunit